MDSPVLDEIKLDWGAHDDRADGVCAMEAVAWLAGEPHSDHPQCACPVIAQLVRSWNDALGDGGRQRLLKPLLPLLVGSKSTPEVEGQRAYMALDWLVRNQTAAWLRLAKLTADAEALSGLPPILDLQAATTAGAVVRTARDYAATGAAAGQGAWNATGEAAVRAAGGAAVRDAARFAAGEAAVRAAAAALPGVRADAAYAAARAATGAAACADAAWAAARSAAVMAAGSAALCPTVIGLQESCAGLIGRMVAIR